jgi:hypothetical protein
MRPGEKVLVFRLAKKVWEEFDFVELEGETVTVQGRNGRKLFRTNVVKPFCDGKPHPREKRRKRRCSTTHRKTKTALSLRKMKESGRSPDKRS